METKQYEKERSRAEALQDILATLPLDKNKIAGHALSIVINRILNDATKDSNDQDSTDGIARFNDSQGYLKKLANFFQSIGNELRCEASRKRNPIDQPTLNQRRGEALRTRMLAAVEAGDGALATRFRGTDLPPAYNIHTGKGSKREFLERTTGTKIDQ